MLGRVHRFWQTLGARCGAAFVVGLVSIPFAAAHAQNYTTLDVTNVNSGATANRIARLMALAGHRNDARTALPEISPQRQRSPWG